MKIGIIVPTTNKRMVSAAINALKLSEDKQGNPYTGYVSSYVVNTEDPHIYPEGRVTVLEAMAHGARQAIEYSGADILAFFHDDVIEVQKDWAEEVVKCFEAEPNVGLLGFGGASGLGTDELYKKPYDLNQLARIDFRSNMKDYHIHGGRLLEPRQVAVLDGFCQIFRISDYLTIGGWEAAIEDGLPPHHMYDAWAACRMKEIGKEVWCLPIKCHHQGGLTATSSEYDDWLRTIGFAGDSAVHRRAHEVIYERFRNVLPIRV